MSRGNIKLALPKKQFRVVAAEIVGDLAVHEGSNAWDLDEGRFHDWTISHVITGYRVFGVRSKSEGIRIAHELMKAADWSFTSPKAVKKFSADAMKKIRALRDEALA